MSGDHGNLWQGSGGESAPQAAWYPDPGGSGLQRYWDGTKWTDLTRADGTQPVPMAPPPPPQSFQAPPYQAQPPYQQPAYQPIYVSPKSPALAIVLTLLWVGAGHFYAGRSDTLPIVLVVSNLVLWVLFVSCLVGILVWIPLVIWACIDARNAAIDFNRRHGLPTPA